MMRYLAEIRWKLACRLLKAAYIVAPDGTARVVLAQHITGWVDACLDEHDRRAATSN